MTASGLIVGGRPLCASPTDPGARLKLTFRSAAAARKYVRRQSGDHRKGHFPYLCPGCHLWHLTSTRQAA